MKQLFRYEKRSEPVASGQQFSSRLLINGIWALGVVVAALAAGMAGYIGFESMSVVDAFVNAAMILSGMGPMTQLVTDAGKIFAVAGLILAPVFHRILHRFHVRDDIPEDPKTQ